MTRRLPPAASGLEKSAMQNSGTRSSQVFLISAVSNTAEKTFASPPPQKGGFGAQAAVVIEEVAADLFRADPSGAVTARFQLSKTRQIRAGPNHHNCTQHVGTFKTLEQEFWKFLKTADSKKCSERGPGTRSQPKRELPLIHLAITE